MNQDKVLSPSYYHLPTSQQVKPIVVEKTGQAYMVNKDTFPALDGITTYCLEVWEESMRLPHWHPNASELGYVISGTIEVMIWRSPGETAVFTVGPGMCWFIPKAALHSLNNIGESHAQLLVGFSSDRPQDIDLPVAFNGIPIPIRNAYTSPHSELQQWQGVIANPLVGKYVAQSPLHSVMTASPYLFDFAKVTPLFNDAQLGSVVWGIKDNWSILEEISALRATLKPGVARDPIWYPDAGTLYVVAKGKAHFNIIIANYETKAFDVRLNDYVYVPMGVLHTFTNASSSEDFQVMAFFTKADPQPEVSLSVATSFFPNRIRKSAMTQYGTENKSGDPLKELNFTEVSPYLVPL